MMKIKRRAPKKREIAEPEELRGQIQDLYSRAGRVFNQYRLVSTIALILIIALSVGGVGYSYLLKKWNKDASELGDNAYQVYLEGDFEGALKAYQKILKDYPSAENAPIVLYYIGNSYAGMGQLDQAIQTYKEVINKYGSNDTMRSLSQIKVGYAYMEKKDYANAISAFKEASELKTSTVADRASYELARAYEMSGDKVSAIEHYETFIKTFPNSPWKQDATANLSKLGVTDGQKKESQQDKKDPEKTEKP